MPTPVNALARACQLVGGQAQLAQMLGIKRQAIHGWIADGRVPADRALQIQRITQGQVTVGELRPDFDWEAASIVHTVAPKQINET
jgi:DNA-binding transcriptional regulator YdaS (Cro superfamily)